MGQIQIGQVVQSGEGEGGQSLERRVLKRQLAQPRQPAEGELSDSGDRVAVKRQPPQLLEALERVRFQLADLVVIERQTLDGQRDVGRYVVQTHSRAHYLPF